MPTLLFYLVALPLFMLGAGYAERKVAAWIQDRLGPTEIGYHGWSQTVADLLKLLQKASLIPRAAHRTLFLLAPSGIFVVVFASFAVLPVTHTWQGAPTVVGTLYIFALITLKSLGIFIAGWSTNNKYARLGAVRALLQWIAYAVPLSISVLCVLVVTQSLDINRIIEQQGSSTPAYFLGIPGIEVNALGGIFTWNIIKMPPLLFAYVVFFIASLAACHRAPFDLPESESELIGGYHTEYGGLRWAWLMMAEYSMMLLMSLWGVILFLGGGHTPFPNLSGLSLGDWTRDIGPLKNDYGWSGFWLFTKALWIIWIKMIIRWTFPRLRFDQTMRLCWQYLTPAALLCCLITLLWQYITLPS